MEKGKIENKLATREVEIKAADCPQRYTHRHLVGTGEPCGLCGVIVPAGPFETSEWSRYGIAPLNERPSLPIPKAEQDAQNEHDREHAARVADLREAERIRAVEIPKLHEITGWTSNGDALQNGYDNRREHELQAKAEDLENSAERHAQKAQAALVRGAELAAKRSAPVGGR
jgi:hypothetical protein